MLLYYHQKRFVELRHHYLTAGVCLQIILDIVCCVFLGFRKWCRFTRDTCKALHIARMNSIQSVLITISSV